MKKIVLVALCALIAGNSAQAIDRKKLIANIANNIAKLRFATFYATGFLTAGLSGYFWGYYTGFERGRKDFTSFYEPQLESERSKTRNLLRNLQHKECGTLEQWALSVKDSDNAHDSWLKYQECKDKIRQNNSL